MSAAVASAKVRHPFMSEFYKFGLIIFGGILQAIGLELLLIPNGFLDGGVVGAAIITAKYVALPVGVFIAILNIPFVVLTWIKLGRRVAARTIVGIATLALSTIILHDAHFEPITDNFALALGYGALCLGLGTGLALRSGGALDGTEALASVLSHKMSWSVDQLILGINVCIFVVAAFTMGPEMAMASALLFYIGVAPIIKRVVDGGSELKLAEIVTNMPEEVIEAIHSQNNRRILSHKAKGMRDNGVLGEIFTLKVLVSRMEESVLGDIILETDPDAVIVFYDASNVRGGVYEEDNHH